MKLVLAPHCIYAVPTSNSAESTKYMIFKVLNFRPGDKSYLQKVMRWSSDVWHEQISIAVLGMTDLKHNAVLLDGDCIDTEIAASLVTHTVLS